MRLLRLTTASGGLLELHPNISVVQGLDDRSRRALVDAVAGLPRGVAPDGSGLLEAQGILLDLTDANLRMLDLERDDLDPVVRASDLPAGDVSPEEQQLRAAEQQLGAARAELERELVAEAAARDAVAAADEAAKAAAAAHEQAAVEQRRWADEQHRLDQRSEELTGARRRLEEELESLAVDLDHRGVDVATSADDGVGGTDLAEDGSPEVRLAHIDARIEELTATLAALRGEDGSPVASALDRLWGIDSEEREPSAEALALADELDALDGDLARRASELGDEHELPSLTDVRSRLDEARGALLEAEQALRNPPLDRDDVAALETAHEELLDAIDKADSRLSGARARRRVDELRAAEEAALERLGFTSYADYVMGHGVRPADPSRQEAVTAARAALAAAEEDWTLQQARAELVLARASLVERRRALIERAGAVLGHPPGPSVADELRELRVPRTSVADCLASLQEALDAAGLAVGDEQLESEELEVMAVAWLSEEAEVGERRQAVEAEIERLRHERDAVAGSADGSPVQEAPPSSEADGHADEGRAAIEDQIRRRRAELASVSQQEADIDRRRRELQERIDPTVVERLEAALRERHADQATAAVRAADHGRARAEAEDRVRSLTAAVADLRGQLVPAAEAAEAGGERIDWYLLARLAAVRSVPLAGSLPILLDDALRGIPEEEVCRVLDRLEPMAEAVQMIVLSEDPAVHRWASSAGAARAAVVAAVPA